MSTDNKDPFDIPSLNLPESDKLPLELQLEELEFIRDRWKEKQLKLTSLQVAQIYIRIANIKKEMMEKSL